MPKKGNYVRRAPGSSVQKGVPKPIGGGSKAPNSKTDKNFMKDVEFGGGHVSSKSLGKKP